MGDDNIVWGNAEGFDNIVWGNVGDDNIVWGNSDASDNITWGNAAGDVDEFFSDDTAEIESFDPSVWEGLFDVPLISITEPVSGGVQ
jgi:hypothetical protein